MELKLGDLFFYKNFFVASKKIREVFREKKFSEVICE